VLKKDEALPPGTKEVRVHRTETYREALAPPGDSPTLSDEVFELSPDEAGEFVDDDAPEPIEQSPFDCFIASFQEDEDVVIYVRRRPDPPGLTFRNPYSGPVQTVGDLPYDSSLDSATALDVAIQRIYGGGHYLLEFKRGGKYAGAKTRYIADPIERANGSAPSAAHDERGEFARVPSPQGGLAEVEKSIELVQKIWGMMSPAARRAETTPAIAAAAANPVADARDTVNMLKDLTGLAKELMPEQVASGGDGGWGTGLFSFLGTVVKELNIGQNLGPLLQAVAASRNGGVQPQPAAPGALPAQAPGPPTEVVPPIAVPLLNVIVPNIFRNDDVDVAVLTTMAWLHGAVQQGHGAPAQKFLSATILDRTPSEVARWFESFQPTLAFIEHGASWLELYRDGLREKVVEAKAAGAASENGPAPAMSEILDSTLPHPAPSNGNFDSAAHVAVVCPKCNALPGAWCGGIPGAVHSERMQSEPVAAAIQPEA